MSNLTPEQIALSASWNAVYEGAGQALGWVDKSRVTAPKLDRDAADLKLGLYQARNMARNLGRVATTPMTTGFFGLSQAGKSYLISALAAGANGALETQFGPQRMNFIESINPSGGGTEATGLVTRFSRLAKPSEDDNFPVELHTHKRKYQNQILCRRTFERILTVYIRRNTHCCTFDHNPNSRQRTPLRIHNLTGNFTLFFFRLR